MASTTSTRENAGARARLSRSVRINIVGAPSQPRDRDLVELQARFLSKVSKAGLPGRVHRAGEELDEGKVGVRRQGHRSIRIKFDEWQGYRRGRNAAGTSELDRRIFGRH